MGALIDYLSLTQKGSLPLLRAPKRQIAGQVLQLDAATRRNLELTHALSGGRANTVLSVLDRTLTAGGARLLERRLSGASTDLTVIRDRGPFTVEDERALFARYDFDAMVTKNSGGDATAAKLVAARERKMKVYMVQRPRGQPWVNCRTPEQMMRRLKRYM